MFSLVKRSGVDELQLLLLLLLLLFVMLLSRVRVRVRVNYIIYVTLNRKFKRRKISNISK